MTHKELQRGNELVKKIKELSDNIYLLNRALTHQERGIKKFFLRLKSKDDSKMIVDGGFTYFGDYLKVDRECLEVIRDHFERKFAEATAEFESIGKGGE